MNSFLDIKARQPSAFGAGPTVYLNSWLNKFIAETDEQIVGLLASSQAMALLPSVTVVSKMPGFFFFFFFVACTHKTYL